MRVNQTAVLTCPTCWWSLGVGSHEQLLGGGGFGIRSQCLQGGGRSPVPSCQQVPSARSALRHPACPRPAAPGDPRSAAWPRGVSGRHPSRVPELGPGKLGGLQPCGQRRNAGKAPSSPGTCPGKHALRKVTGMVIIRSLNGRIRDFSSVLKYFCLLKNHFPTLSFTIFLLFCYF